MKRIPILILIITLERLSRMGLASLLLETGPWSVIETRESIVPIPRNAKVDFRSAAWGKALFNDERPSRGDVRQIAGSFKTFTGEYEGRAL